MDVLGTPTSSNRHPFVTPGISCFVRVHGDVLQGLSPYPAHLSHAGVVLSAISGLSLQTLATRRRAVFTAFRTRQLTPECYTRLEQQFPDVSQASGRGGAPETVRVV